MAADCLHYPRALEKATQNALVLFQRFHGGRYLQEVTRVPSAWRQEAGFIIFTGTRAGLYSPHHQLPGVSLVGAEERDSERRRNWLQE